MNNIKKSQIKITKRETEQFTTSKLSNLIEDYRKHIVEQKQVKKNEKSETENEMPVKPKKKQTFSKTTKKMAKFVSESKKKKQLKSLLKKNCILDSVNTFLKIKKEKKLKVKSTSKSREMNTEAHKKFPKLPTFTKMLNQLNIQNKTNTQNLHSKLFANSVIKKMRTAVFQVIPNKQVKASIRINLRICL